MIEKRFTYCPFDGFDDDGKQMSSQEVEETLNKFQELSIKDLKKIEQLEKENEQLKREINILKITIGRNEGYIQRMKYGGEWR